MSTRSRNTCLSWIAIGGLVATALSAALAQPPAPADIAALLAEREALAAEVAELDHLESAPEAGAQRELYRELEHVLDAQLALLARDDDTASSEPLGEMTKGSFGLRDLDRTARAREQAVEAVATAQRAIEDTQRALEASSERLADAERFRRQAKEEHTNGSLAAEALATAQLASRVEAQRVALRRAELRYWELRHEEARSRLDQVGVQQAQQLANLVVDPHELDEILGELDKHAFDLERQIQQQRYAVEENARLLERALAAADGGERAAPRRALEARRAALTAERRIETLLGESRARLDVLREVWERRFRLQGGEIDRATAARWEGEVSTTADALRRERGLKRARVDELERELATLGGELPEGDLLAPALRKLLDTYRADLAMLDEHRFAVARLHDALLDRSARLRLLDRLGKAADVASSVWRYEVWASEDNPITIAKLFTAVAVFGLGFPLARSVSRRLGRSVFARLAHDDGAVHAFEALTFYLLLVIVFLTALRVVNIPLTAFAVLGGALAIGVGFGSQNVVNNFISGVILLAERPIKLGDLVEVGEVYGTVEQIGLRSTRVRTGDNVHIILPNSSILENQVINWTHNDTRVRIKVVVGIAYGSPTREAERLIKRVLADHPRIHATPEPIVLFSDFGSDSLVFEARFWVTMRALMERLRIESDVRFGIDDAFREAGITIAFPQRDVHLDSLRPVEIRLVGGDPSDREETPS